MATNTDPATPNEGEEDPYVNICRAMQEGMLLTVNASEPTEAGVDEMEVTHVDEETGNLTLEGHNGRIFTIRHDDREYGGPAIKEISPSEFKQTHEPVITIELIGFA